MKLNCIQMRYFANLFYYCIIEIQIHMNKVMNCQNINIERKKKLLFLKVLSKIFLNKCFFVLRKTPTAVNFQLA